MARYVPILKGKEGEFAALETLAPEVKADVFPLIEVVGVPFNYSTGQNAKTLDQHIKGLPDRLNKSWGDRPFFLETPFFGDDGHLADDRCAFGALLDRCTQAGLNPIPVITTRSTVSCRNSVRTRVAKGSGLCLRLQMRDFAEDVETSDEVRNVLLSVGKDSPAGLDVIIDFAELKTDSSTSLLLARSVLSMLPAPAEWRSVIIAAASFPEDLSAVNTSSSVTMPREEWNLWRALQRKPSLLPANLIFADYAISHPLIRGIDPRIMRMSASIRYTTPDSWLVMKGRNVGQYGFEQYFELCKRLIARPEYAGANFSWGDEFIDKCARREAGPGNATTWRKVGVNHHITMVARQLANPA